MRRVCVRAVVALLGGVLPAIPAHAGRTAHVPDWVKAAAATPLPPHQPRDAAAILLDQTDITVAPDGIATVHHRKVVRILTAAGRAWGEDDLRYDSAGKVHYLHAWTIGADGHEYEQEDKDNTDVSAVPQFEVYDSGRIRAAQALAVEPGATVAFESEMVEDRNTTAWLYGLDETIPSTGQSVTLTLPAGFNPYTAWTRIAPVAPAQPALRTWLWQIGPRPSLTPEAAAPVWGDVTARMLLTYAGPGMSPSDGSWGTVGGWYSGLAAGRTDISPAMQSTVATLIAGKPGFADRLQAITGFVQDNIRYVAVEMGIGGWQPHPAAQVFQNQYGDCKDKATLLIAMLAQAGIVAHPVLADFDHQIDPAVPSHYADHMITAIEIPAGVTDPSLQAVVPWNNKRLLIFDPTNAVAPPGALESELQGSWGVLLAGTQTTPLRLPVLPPSDNLLIRTGQFTLTAGGSLSGDVTEQRTGSTAEPWRELAIDGDQRKLQQREERVLRNAVPGSTLSALAVQDARDRAQPLHIGFRMAVDNYPRHAGAMLLVRPAVLGLYEGENLEDGRPRLYPIRLGAERELREDYTITLPPGYKTDDLPDPVHLETPFATYESAVTSTGTALHFHRDLVIHTMQLPASDEAQYEDFFGKVAGAEHAEALLTVAR